MRITAGILLLAALVASPSAIAIAGTLALETAEATLVQGEVAAVFPAGNGHASILAARATWSAVITGRATIESWNVTRSPAGGLADGRIAAVEHEVANGTLRFTWDGADVRTNILAGEGGAIVVRGPVDASGAPTFLNEDVTSGFETSAIVRLEGRQVPFALRAGDAFVGFHASPAPHVGFPFDRRATIDLRGPVAFHMDGGLVALTDANGSAFEYRLGEETPSGAEPDVTRFRRLIVEGHAHRADMPVFDRWIAGGPTVSWEVDGRLLWRNATGTATTPEGVERFERADVVVVGAGVAEPGARAVAATLGPTTYAAEGEWSSIRIGATELGGAVAPPPVAQAVGAAALLAVAAAALTDLGQGIAGRAMAALYTRILPQRILDHPTRARIREIVTAEPGIHLSELHRRIGGAWGPFTFHLSMLERVRVLAVHKQGRFRAAYPAGEVAARLVIRSGSARRVLDELLAAGGAGTIPDLTRSTGLSRQLVRHHMKLLQAQGLVEQQDARVWRATQTALHERSSHP